MSGCVLCHGKYELFGGKQMAFLFNFSFKHNKINSIGTAECIQVISSNTNLFQL